MLDFWFIHFLLLCPWTLWHNGTLFRRSISSIFHWIFILSRQRSWGVWHQHLSPSQQCAPATVAGSWTCCLCNPEGWRQWPNGVCPTKSPAAFSIVLFNTLGQNYILLGTVWKLWDDSASWDEVAKRGWDMNTHIVIPTIRCPLTHRATHVLQCLIPDYRSWAIENLPPFFILTV